MEVWFELSQSSDKGISCRKSEKLFQPPESSRLSRPRPRPLSSPDYFSIWHKHQVSSHWPTATTIVQKITPFLFRRFLSLLLYPFPSLLPVGHNGIWIISSSKSKTRRWYVIRIRNPRRNEAWEGEGEGEGEEKILLSREAWENREMPHDRTWLLDVYCTVPERKFCEGKKKKADLTCNKKMNRADMHFFPFNRKFSLLSWHPRISIMPRIALLSSRISPVWSARAKSLNSKLRVLEKRCGLLNSSRLMYNNIDDL